MKSLYNETDNTHTVDAHALEERAHRVIGPVFESFVKLGYSPREISHEILSVVFEIELETVLASRPMETTSNV